VVGSADEGRISAATRADYAAAAAAVLLADDQAGAVHELGGDDAFTLGDLAQAVERWVNGYLSVQHGYADAGGVGAVGRSTGS
jgi:NAD(P)H dehydrogenase (quinone)